MLRWSADGTQLLFVPFMRHWGGKRAAAADPMVLTLVTGKLRHVFRSPSVDWSPNWSPDGRAICYVSHNLNTAEPWSHSRSLYVRLIEGGEASLISGGNIGIWPVPPTTWGPGNVIYATSLESATARLYAFHPDGRTPTLVTPKRFHVRSYSLSADGRRLAAILEDANTPPEIYLGDPQTRQFEKLTDFGRSLSGITFGQADILKWQSSDGRFDVEGFVVKPPDFKPGIRYPLLVGLHGGPAGLILNSFADVNLISGAHSPAQLYAAQGYIVLLPNPRGDPSYGTDFLVALVKHWGDDVEHDVLPGVDALVSRGMADPDRLGIMGFSYGAYATAWALTRTDRFKAASVSDGAYNLLSYYGQAYLTNDGWLDYYLGGNPSEVQQEYLKRSPILFSEHIKTPTLIRMGQNQFPRATAISQQALELFRALHQRQVPVDLVYHSTQGHVIEDEEVYRDWVMRNLRWFDYWVLRKGSNPLGGHN
jgi:dipeptidyl aminopeptidase/acylaminoacyl peptidase